MRDRHVAMVFRRRPPPSEPAGAETADGFTAEALSYVDSLYGTALRLTRRPADADDLVLDDLFRCGTCRFLA